MNHAAQATAVVVAYKSAATLSACLSSLLADDAIAQVVVIDNSEEPSSADIASAYGEKVVYVGQPNAGFAAGCNRGLALTSTPFIAFVNPDLQMLRPLGPLLDFLISHPRALVAGESSTTAHSSARRTVTPAREVAKAIMGARAYSLPRFTGTEPVRVEQLSGAFIAARTDHARSLGGFDERFELYYEDVDLCQRADSAGGCWLFPETHASHTGGESFALSGGTAFIASRVSRVRYLRKHFTPPIAVGAAMVSSAVEWAVRTLTRQPEGAAARRRALRATIAEIQRPNSVHALDQRRPSC